MNRMEPTVNAYWLNLNHKISEEGQVLRLLSDYQSISIQIDSPKQDDVVITNAGDMLILVASPDLAQYLETRPLILKRGETGDFLGFKDRRRGKRLSI